MGTLHEGLGIREELKGASGFKILSLLLVYKNPLLSGDHEKLWGKSIPGQLIHDFAAPRVRQVFSTLSEKTQRPEATGPSCLGRDSIAQRLHKTALTFMWDVVS